MNHEDRDPVDLYEQAEREAVDRAYAQAEPAPSEDAGVTWARIAAKAALTINALRAERDEMMTKHRAAFNAWAAELVQLRRDRDRDGSIIESLRTRDSAASVELAEAREDVADSRKLAAEYRAQNIALERRLTQVIEEAEHLRTKLDAFDGAKLLRDALAKSDDDARGLR